MWWSGAQNRSLVKPRGTRSPSTKYLHEILKGMHYPRTDCPGGGGDSILGRDVRGGQYILGRNGPGERFRLLRARVVRLPV